MDTGGYGVGGFEIWHLYGCRPPLIFLTFMCNKFQEAFQSETICLAGSTMPFKVRGIDVR